MAAPILWTPGKKRPFCGKSHVHKIPRFGGGGHFGFGGGSADFIFMGARTFLTVTRSFAEKEAKSVYLIQINNALNCSCMCMCLELLIQAPRHKNVHVFSCWDLRGPAAILLISRDACSDSIANIFRACFMQYRTFITQYVAKWGIAQKCLCETKYHGGGIAPFWGSANLP